MVPERFYLLTSPSPPSSDRNFANWFRAQICGVTCFSENRENLKFQSRMRLVCVCVCVCRVIYIFWWGEPAFSTSFSYSLSIFCLVRTRARAEGWEGNISSSPLDSTVLRSMRDAVVEGKTRHISIQNLDSSAVLLVKLRHLCLSIHPVKCEPFIVSPLLPSF